MSWASRGLRELKRNSTSPLGLWKKRWMGTIAGSPLASALPWYVGAATSCTDLLCQGQRFLKPAKIPGAVGAEDFLLEAKEGPLEGGPGICPWKSQWEDRQRVYHSDTESRKAWPTTNPYQPEHVGHHPLWVGQRWRGPGRG